jgi:hypothetical protein
MEAYLALSRALAPIRNNAYIGTSEGKVRSVAGESIVPFATCLAGIVSH